MSPQRPEGAGPHPSAETFGCLLARLRRSRGFSQLSLGLTAEVSSRHICFLEGGRARPSRGMIQRLADTLDASPAERRALMRAAGFIPLDEKRTARPDPSDAFAVVLGLETTSDAKDLLGKAAWGLQHLGVDLDLAARLSEKGARLPTDDLLEELEQRPLALGLRDPAQRLAHRLICEALARRLVDWLERSHKDSLGRPVMV